MMACMMHDDMMACNSAQCTMAQQQLVSLSKRLHAVISQQAQQPGSKIGHVVTCLLRQDPPRHLSWQTLHSRATGDINSADDDHDYQHLCAHFEESGSTQPLLPPLAIGPSGLMLPAYRWGYPCQPLLTAICQSLAAWVLTMQFPFQQMEACQLNLLKEIEVYGHKKAWLQQLVCDNRDSILQCSSEPGSEVHDTGWIEALFSDPQAILILLGFRITAGTTTDVTAVPGLLQCVQSFGCLHATTSNSRLTVGARALSKHCHRDSSAFWGQASGPESVKNTAAADVLVKLLQGAVWLNLHYMPHADHVLELRVKEGYGARWHVSTTTTYTGSTPPSASGTDEGGSAQDGVRTTATATTTAAGLLTVKFRGFLEPQDENGHAVGWRH